MSSQRKIIIATTFRDFTGSSNDNIQHLFLESLKNQTYTNWQLAVTIYKEKNVENTIKKSGLPAEFFKGGNGEFRFSHSEVLLNGLSLSKGSNDIIIWTTCDVIFQNNFLATVSGGNYDVCTSHPHYMYRSTKEFVEHSHFSLKLAEGIDTLVFNSGFLKQTSIDSNLHKYKYTDWGIFEHFLVALSYTYKARMINLWGETTISKIVNDRKITKEGKKYLEDSWNRNYEVIADFLSHKGLTNDFLDLTYINLRFSPIRRFKYFKTFILPITEYYFKRSRRVNSLKARSRRLITWFQ